MCVPSARAHHSRYTADLKGSTVSPPTGSTALGHVVVIIDFDVHRMQILTEFSGLAGTVTEAHLHGPTDEVFAGTAGTITPLPAPDGFPTGVTSGAYTSASSTSTSRRRTTPRSWLPTGLSSVARCRRLFDALGAGKAYFDIHTTAFPAGEIRGFVVDVPGDFNDDGIVDAADYVVWQKTEGTIGEGNPADADNSSVVDEADYLIWRESFGSTRHDRHEHHHGAGAGQVAIPEPASFAITAIALFFAAGFSSRRDSNR